MTPAQLEEARKLRAQLLEMGWQNVTIDETRLRSSGQSWSYGVYWSQYEMGPRGEVVTVDRSRVQVMIARCGAMAQGMIPLDPERVGEIAAWGDTRPR